MELSLVIFTVLSQISIGLAVMLAVRQWAVSEGTAPSSFRIEWIVVGLTLAVALAASLFHLGHPFGSPRAILHLSSSWLSREIVVMQIFGILVLVALVALWKGSANSWALIKITALVGLVGLAVSGMVYAPPSFPALNNGVPIIFYGLTAFILGSAFSSYFAGEDKQPLLTQILTISLIVGLVINLILPSIWLSGGRVMQMTGAAYYGSALFWLRLVVEFGLGLAVLGIIRKIPIWLPVLLLAGEIAGRIMFFTHVVHSAVNIGNLY
jgi:DMSO reductase anchor subunit